MALVTGPLMSLEASGTIGQALTFSNWVGRSYVRRYTIPSNPQTSGQMDNRNRFSVLGTITQWAARNSQTTGTEAKTVQQYLTEAAPSDQRWNGFLLRMMNSGDGANYKAADTAWGLLEPGDQDAWDSAAGNLTPPIQSAGQRDVGGIAKPAISPGQVMFTACYALFLLGALAEAPDATPTTFT